MPNSPSRNPERTAADLIELAATWCQSAADTENNAAVSNLWATRAKMLRDGYQPMLVRAMPSEMAKPHWIPISERMPEKDTEVLVWQKSRHGGTGVQGKSFAKSDHFDSRYDAWFRCDGYHEVTHWMELPASP